MDWDVVLCRCLGPSFQAEWRLRALPGVVVDRVADQVFSRQLVFQVCVNGRLGFIGGIELGETEGRNELGWVGRSWEEMERSQKVWSLQGDGPNHRPPGSFDSLFEVSGAVSFGGRWHWGFKVYSASPTLKYSPATWELQPRSIFLARSQGDSKLLILWPHFE